MPSLATMRLTASRKPESARLDSTCARVERVMRGYLLQLVKGDVFMRREVVRQRHRENAPACTRNGMDGSIRGSHFGLLD
jgi:hypothetical protein